MTAPFCAAAVVMVGAVAAGDWGGPLGTGLVPPLPPQPHNKAPDNTTTANIGPPSRMESSPKVRHRERGALRRLPSKHQRPLESNIGDEMGCDQTHSS